MFFVSGARTKKIRIFSFISAFIIVFSLFSSLPVSAAEQAKDGVIFSLSFDAASNKLVVTADLANRSLKVNTCTFIIKYDTTLLSLTESGISPLGNAKVMKKYLSTDKGFAGGDFYYLPSVSASSKNTHIASLSFSLKSGRSFTDISNNSVALCTESDNSALKSFNSKYGGTCGILLLNGSTDYSAGNGKAYGLIKNPVVGRLSGTTRIDTANAISSQGWTSSTYAVIASGANYPDALAGIPLAAARNCPILLTFSASTGLESTVVSELNRLGVKKVYLLGGEYVISKKIESSLVSKYGQANVKRLYGEARCDTAIAIAQELASIRKEKGLGAFTNVYFCSGSGFADALSISSVAGKELNPILYAPASGSMRRYSPYTYNYLVSLKYEGCSKATIIGGIYAVSEDAQADLEKIMGSSAKVERIHTGITGNRYDTSLAVIQRYASVYSSNGIICTATGASFPDALSGGALASKLGSPIILVGYTDAKNTVSSVNSKLRSYIASINVKKCIVFGGVYVVPDSQINLMFGYSSSSGSSADYKTVSFLGDSITAGDFADNLYFMVLEERNGWVCKNYGCTSSGYVNCVTAGVGKYGHGESCGADNEVMKGENSFPMRLKEIDGNSDLIVVFGGTNDYAANIPIAAYEKAVLGTINDIRKLFPESKMLFLTPTMRNRTKTSDPLCDGKTKNLAGCTLLDYVNSVISICESESVPVINLYTADLIDPYDLDERDALMPDGLHPSDDGHILIADAIENECITLLLD